MLSKENRLSLKTDRFRIEKEGRTFSSRLFTYLIAPRPNLLLPIRFAVLISKKSTPLSVNRHFIKRHLTEIIRHNLERFGRGRDIILIPKKNIFDSSNEQVLEDLTKTLSHQ